MAITKFAILNSDGIIVEEHDVNEKISRKCLGAYNKSIVYRNTLGIVFKIPKGYAVSIPIIEKGITNNLYNYDYIVTPSTVNDEYFINVKIAMYIAPDIPHVEGLQPCESDVPNITKCKHTCANTSCFHVHGAQGACCLFRPLPGGCACLKPSSSTVGKCVYPPSHGCPSAGPAPTPPPKPDYCGRFGSESSCPAGCRWLKDTTTAIGYSCQAVCERDIDASCKDPASDKNCNGPFSCGYDKNGFKLRCLDNTIVNEGAPCTSSSAKCACNCPPGMRHDDFDGNDKGCQPTPKPP